MFYNTVEGCPSVNKKKNTCAYVFADINMYFHTYTLKYAYFNKHKYFRIWL